MSIGYTQERISRSRRLTYALSVQQCAILTVNVITIRYGFSKFLVLTIE